MSLKNNTRVVMHSCFEAGFEKNKGTVFVTDGEPFNMCGSEVVALNYEDTGKRADSSFSTEYLKPAPSGEVFDER